MYSRERRWHDEDEGLQVFVPGLMATGILVSIGMFIWDGIKKFLPDMGGRQRAARLRKQTAGRVNDLTGIDRGVAPIPVHMERVRRSRGSALLLALGAFALAASVGFVTTVAYSGTGSSFSGRGWTLSMGGGVVVTSLLLGSTWLWSALVDNSPAWLTRAQARWPIGGFPDIDETDR